jgi:pimeloyl-ACP methyl ester carboxylesterase
VVLWQGLEDRATPPVMAHHLSRQLPACRLHLIEGEGHFSLPIRYMDKILADFKVGRNFPFDIESSVS